MHELVPSRAAQVPQPGRCRPGHDELRAAGAQRNASNELSGHDGVDRIGTLDQPSEHAVTHEIPPLIDGEVEVVHRLR